MRGWRQIQNHKSGANVAAARLDIYIDHGASFCESIQITNEAVAPATVGTPINLTGNVFRGKIKKTLADSDSVIVFSCTLKDQTTETGVFQFSLTSVQTSSIPMKSQRVQERVAEPFAYDIERVFADGKVERVLEGIAYISPRVST